MNLNLSSFNYHFLQLIFSKGSGIFRPLIFSLFFLVNGFVVGQDKTDSLKTHPVISVKNGASIYSLDESFNEQVRNSNIVKDGTTTVARNNNNRETVTIESVPKTKTMVIRLKAL